MTVAVATEPYRVDTIMVYNTNTSAWLRDDAEDRQKEDRNDVAEFS